MDDQSVISNLLQIIQVRQQLEVLFEIFVRPPWILSISFTFYYKNQNFKRNPYLQLCKICFIMNLLVLHVYILFIIHFSAWLRILHEEGWWAIRGPSVCHEDTDSSTISNKAFTACKSILHLFLIHSFHNIFKN